MSKVEYHAPSPPGGGRVCLYDQEEWPCLVVRVRAEVIRATAAELAELVRPEGREPGCCDEHSRAWGTRKDAAEEIEDWAREKLEEIGEVPG